MSETIINSWNVPDFTRTVNKIGSGGDADVFKVGEKVLKEYRTLPLAKGKLYQEATQAAMPIVAAFTTNTDFGLIRYRLNPILEFFEGTDVEKVYTVSRYIRVKHISKSSKFYLPWLKDLGKLSLTIMKETGFKGISITPFINTAEFLNKDGMLCVITDICEKVRILTKS